ncbi:hypothetical protein TVAG_383140 [Trichomonas vaginalis G3]|uniref:Uncharacterized protein n=1 Tax=Trichomonas vaginalis (strain ATCC PRA-98 / G3) TaxID=412133 RepID=A2G3H4_TRIV3|nr:hypothetical protein TVAGG3_0360310 [Trichomonas vaginalis G3]EAX88291.1 hypothetical protein TVAG_383140 [Trichomonas vaginalis G3]KAI5531896.1 hypothetical protein TVAGG3_0360310 [Trichomonas vaginalis G3]|eukprot:XP_001301221.1 hypothetical protein [Trichomonas vaginalis G3]
MGHCIQDFVCSYNCSSSFNSFAGSHCCIYPKENSVNKCQIFHSSIAENKGYGYSVFFQEGDLLISGLNFSVCNCERYSAYTIINPRSNGICNYSTISRCSSSERGIIQHAQLSQKIDHCNILNNTTPNSSIFGVVLSWVCTLSIEESCFLKNISPHLFAIYANPSSISLNRCLFDSSASTLHPTLSGGITFKMANNVNSLNLRLHHYPPDGCGLNNQIIFKCSIKNNNRSIFSISSFYLAFISSS